MAKERTRSSSSGADDGRACSLAEVAVDACAGCQRLRRFIRHLKATGRFDAGPAIDYDQRLREFEAWRCRCAPSSSDGEPLLVTFTLCLVALSAFGRAHAKWSAAHKEDGRDGTPDRES